MEIAERDVEIAGLPVRVRRAGDAPILYLHGVPTAGWSLEPFLARTGGLAPDLPGFGASAKPGDFDYSIAGYGRFLESFCAAHGLERLSLVMHDWGAVGLAFAARFPERIERLVLLSAVPLLPGYEWHRVARVWRTPAVGELAMGFTGRRAFRRAVPRALADRAYAEFDHGTQRAILRLHRAAGPEALAQAGAELGELRCKALLVWPRADPYAGPEWGARYADALGGEATLELVDAGHWSWLDRPALIDRVHAFFN